MRRVLMVAAAMVAGTIAGLALLVGLFLLLYALDVPPFADFGIKAP